MYTTDSYHCSNLLFEVDNVLGCYSDAVEEENNNDLKIYKTGNPEDFLPEGRARKFTSFLIPHTCFVHYMVLKKD